MSMFEADMNFVQRHMNWRVKSGVAERSSVCRVHKSVCDGLHHFQSYDHLNMWGPAGVQQLVRQLHVWETTTRRNPNAPDFEGWTWCWRRWWTRPGPYRLATSATGSRSSRGWRRRC